MWFLLGFLFGILFSILALFCLAWYLEHHDQHQRLQRWLNKFDPKKERKFRPSEGSIGCFVLNERGDIERMADDA